MNDSAAPASPSKPRFFKVIACEIAFRELCHVAADSPNLLEFEFLTQGYHDVPATGCGEIQKRINAVPPGKYDAILLVYGLCSNILSGLRTEHTPLIIPRAHDCITFFLGSKERYQEFFDTRPGTYYYSSGWIECAQRRGEASLAQGNLFMPSTVKAAAEATRKQWVEKYGQEQADYLMETMGGWTSMYNRATLINFDFALPLNLRARVEHICADQGWQYDEVQGDLTLLRRLVDGKWNEKDFLVVQPKQSVVPSYDQGVIKTEPTSPV